ncbi:hypothetical protein B0H14DRAFT_709813 [Mycena olivaceomarginata]|nr:hypothetical protein B0H14DRAFT_709813 [Mycena olivaceomarginata]
MTATLPQELIDAILDHLAGDPPSLKACSLVSCAWVPCTRLHLFKICTLNPRSVFDFSVLLRSPHCTFRLHIRSIHLLREIPTSTLHNKFDDPAFAVDLRGLTGVRAFELTFNTSAARPLPDGASPYMGFLAAFPQLTRLVLKGLQMRALAPLVDTICLFPALQELHLQLWHPFLHPTDPTEYTALAAPPRALHSLVLCRHSVGSVLPWLHAAGHLPTLRVLKLHALFRNQMTAMGAALQQARLGSSLRHLQRLDVSLNWLLGTPPLLDLTHHGALRTLILRNAFELFDSSETLRCLMRLAVPALECLAFELYLPPFQRTSARNFDWAALDAFLASLNASRVVFFETIDRTDPSEDTCLRRVLPRAEAAGILQIEWLRVDSGEAWGWVEI